MTFLEMSCNALTETIALADLPENMEIPHALTNNLRETLHFQSLPVGMQQVNLSENALTGEISLKCLSKRLRALRLNNTTLNGTIRLTSLPPAFKILSLDDNTFEESLDLTRIPGALDTLRLSHNVFSGEIDVRKLPEGWMDFDVRNNRFVPTRRKDTSPWWVGLVPQFWGSQEPFTLCPLSLYGAGPTDGHSEKWLGRTITHLFWGSPETPFFGEDEETHPLIISEKTRDEISPQEITILQAERARTRVERHVQFD
ncbi:leucine-rich repeat protein [Perkinsela sp. CCAP 1560/4]|nr:leucine-rich repeat protein [Perkinsela sp. CCAP 1560/4]|eukprot:KNH03759.1 leucine-rich repeat protein [Perkinsela sp. CCAP 1560/4]